MARLAALRPKLDERRWRLVMGAEATAWGWGGVAAVHRATGASKSTISRGVRELDAGGGVDERVRSAGAGRKLVEVAQPGLVEALDGLVDASRRGDPESALMWTTKSTRKLATELTSSGFSVSHSVVAKILTSLGYSLQSVRKKMEGSQHPDRDGQFRYIAGEVEEFLAAGDPVISVDTKKKELVGAFARPGREWHPTGEPDEVNTYDFPHLADGKAIPYGVYDIGDDSAWVSVGVDHDTSPFAVATIAKWWNKMGAPKYPDATRLLITADGGGSNGHRPWLWKHELARLAAATGLGITVAHFPPGTSKWNKIEHRLFSRITLNWRGRPLTSYQTIVSLIANTSTTTGLAVYAELDPAGYPTAITLTQQQKKSIPIKRHDYHGDWNYTITTPNQHN